jgi:hypothetical protein
VAENVSMAEFLLKAMEENLFSGDLTEHFWSDGGDAQLPDQQGQGLAEPSSISNRKAKKRERTKLKRNQERSRMQQEIGTGQKMSTLKKFPAHITRVAIQTGFDAMAAKVTLPGWVGPSLRNLPPKQYKLKELTETHHLRLIPWNGRYVTLHPTSARALICFLELPTS